MKEIIMQLIEKQRNYEQRAAKMKKVIDAIQSTCDHDYVHEDTTPYYRIEVCTKCLHKIHV
jgi:alpha-D-ribose 1-methylphosphonate 5-triphosphate diphosphatase PhnM